MTGQTSLQDEKAALHLQGDADLAALSQASLPLQVDAHLATLSQDVATQRSTRFLWTVLSFAVLVLLGVSACAVADGGMTIQPFPSRDSEKAAPPSSHAFMPVFALRPAIRPAGMSPALGSGGLNAAARKTAGLRRSVAVGSIAEQKTRMPVHASGMQPGVRRSPDLSGFTDSDEFLPGTRIRSIRGAIEKTPEFNFNVGRAIGSLEHDIPQILRREGDPRRATPMNWDIYTNTLETDFSKLQDPVLLRLLTAIAPVVKMGIKGADKGSNPLTIKGENLNKQALDKLRGLTRQFVEKEMVVAKTKLGVDSTTNDEVIECRWQAKLASKTLQLPFMGRTPEGLITLQAISRLRLNTDGHIYQHAIEELKIFLDGKPIDLKTVDFWVKIITGLTGS